MREVHAWHIELERVPPWCDAALSPDELERACRFHGADHRRRFMAAHGALRAILARYAGADPASLRFDTAQRGKPRLAGGGALRFNLSHSGDLALLAVSNDCEVGIDIERIRPGVPIESIAQRFFSSAECARLLALAPEARPAHFYRCWTRKEALLKGTGAGLSGLSAAAPPGWSIQDLDAGPGYAAAVAAKAPAFRLQTFRWPE